MKHLSLFASFALVLVFAKTGKSNGATAFAWNQDPCLLDTVKPSQQKGQIVERYWKLLSLNDQPVISKDDRQSEPHMILKDFRTEVRGNGGCNSFTATYKLFEGDSIAVHTLLAKEEPCKNISTERRFFKFLTKAVHYQVEGDTLRMRDASGKQTAKFSAVYLQ